MSKMGIFPPLRKAIRKNSRKNLHLSAGVGNIIDMQRHCLRKLLSLSAFLLAVALVSASCFGGSDDDSSDSTAEEPTAPIAELVAPPTPTAAPPPSTTLAVSPQTETTATPVTPALTYTIQSGDYLALIAERFNTTVEEILAANPDIANADMISAGQVLNIPSQSTSAASSNSSASSGSTSSGSGPNNADLSNSNTASADGSATNSGAQQTYTVVAGDTFAGIAIQFNVSLADLEAANPQITNTDQLGIGQEITIP